MAIRLQSNHNNVASGATSLDISYLNGLTAGSLLVVYAGSPATNRSFSASDGVNGSWNADVNPGKSAAILSFPSTAAGTPTVTVTMSGGAGEITAIIEEWTGVVGVSPLDQTASSTNSAATSGSTGTTGTLAQANELCLAMISLSSPAQAASITVASPFSASPSSPWPAGIEALVGAASYQPGSTAAVSATFAWTVSAASRGAIATYKLSPVQSPLLGNCFISL